MVNDYIYYVKNMLQAKITSSNNFETIYLVNVVYNEPSKIIINLEIIYADDKFTVRYVMYVDTKIYECVLGVGLDLFGVRTIVNQYRLLYFLEKTR